MGVLANGVLYKFLEGRGHEDVHYEVDIPYYMVGGEVNPSTYTTTFNLPFKPSTVRNAVLELGVMMHERATFRWKISFSDVVVTREFKPLACIKFREKLYCKLVYNVKPIVESKEAREYRTTIRHLGGSEVTLTHLTFIATADFDEAESYYQYLSGFLELKSGEKYTINVPSGLPGDTTLHVITILPEPKSQAQIVAGGRVLAVLQGALVRSASIELGKATDVSFITNSGTTIISTILLSSVTVPQPDIKIVSKEVRGEDIRVVLRNEGSADAEKVVISSIALGVVVDRVILEKLRKTEEVEVRVKGRRGSINTIRLVWSFRGRTLFRDYKLKI